MSLMRSTTLPTVRALVGRGPSQLYAVLRERLLFLITYGMRHMRLVFWGNVILGKNVRIQRASSLMAERPEATIAIGAHSIVYERCRMEAFGAGVIQVGECCILGGVRIACRAQVVIGSRVLASWGIYIQDFVPHPVDANRRAEQVTMMVAAFRPAFEEGWDRPTPQWEREFPAEQVIIGDDVWLGANVTILPGAHIGDRCIVGTGAVVARGQYPAGSIIVGNPARVVERTSQ